MHKSRGKRKRNKPLSQHHNQKKTKIYGELESGLLFLLNPPWLEAWQEDEIRQFERRK